MGTFWGFFGFWWGEFWYTTDDFLIQSGVLFGRHHTPIVMANLLRALEAHVVVYARVVPSLAVHVVVLRYKVFHGVHVQPLWHESSLCMPV